MEKDYKAVVAKFYIEPNAIDIIVEASEVEHRSHLGYGLSAVVHTDVLVTAEDVEEKPVQDPGYSYPNRNETITRRTHHLAREARFVMRLNPESAVALKEQQISDVREEKRLVALELAGEKEKLQALAKEKADLETKVAALQRNYDYATQDRDGIRESKRKLEGDIGKLRTAIGDLRMKEILGT